MRGIKTTQFQFHSIGSQCGVHPAAGHSRREDITGGGKVDQMDAASKATALSAKVDIKGRALMNDPKYSALLQSRGLVVQGSLSALTAYKDTSGKSLMTYDINGTYYGLKSDIGYKMNVQGLTHSNLETMSSESVISTELQFPSFTVSLVVHSSYPTNQTAEIYLNGNPLTQSQLNDLFGKNNPAVSVVNQSVMQVLR